jgi:hypothetical protein
MCLAGSRHGGPSAHISRATSEIIEDYNNKKGSLGGASLL